MTLNLFALVFNFVAFVALLAIAMSASVVSQSIELRDIGARYHLHWMTAWNEFETIPVDLNIDGFLDFLHSGSLDGVPHDPRGYPSALMNRTDGTYAAVAIAPFSSPPTLPYTGVEVGVLDGGNLPDVVTILNGWPAQNAGLPRAWRQASPGAFQPRTDWGIPTSIPGAKTITVIDADGNGFNDLVIWINGSAPMLFMNDGQGRFTERIGAFPGVGEGVTTSVKAVDLDGDGDLDLVVPRWNTNVIVQAPMLIFHNDGNGLFTIAQSLGEHRRVAVGDFDQDGFPDLLASYDYLSGFQHLYRNDGSGHFLDVSALLPMNGNNSLYGVFGDLDGDGLPEIICVTNQPSPRVWKFENRTRFVDVTATSVPIPVSGGIYHLHAVDVDRDGDLDIVVRSRDYNNIYGPTFRALINMRRQLDSPLEVPIGTSLPLTAYSQEPMMWFPILSLRTALLELPGLGLLTIDPVGSVALSSVQSNDRQPATLTLPIPNDPTLRTARVQFQALTVTTTPPTSRITLSNRVHVTIR